VAAGGVANRGAGGGGGNRDGLAGGIRAGRRRERRRFDLGRRREGNRHAHFGAGEEVGGLLHDVARGVGDGDMVETGREIGDRRGGGSGGPRVGVGRGAVDGGGRKHAVV